MGTGLQHGRKVRSGTRAGSLGSFDVCQRLTKYRLTELSNFIWDGPRPWNTSRRTPSISSCSPPSSKTCRTTEKEWPWRFISGRCVVGGAPWLKGARFQKKAFEELGFWMGNLEKPPRSFLPTPPLPFWYPDFPSGATRPDAGSQVSCLPSDYLATASTSW